MKLIFITALLLCMNAHTKSQQANAEQTLYGLTKDNKFFGKEVDGNTLFFLSIIFPKDLTLKKIIISYDYDGEILDTQNLEIRKFLTTVSEYCVMFNQVKEHYLGTKRIGGLKGIMITFIERQMTEVITNMIKEIKENILEDIKRKNYENIIAQSKLSQAVESRKEKELIDFLTIQANKKKIIFNEANKELHIIEKIEKLE